MKPKVLCRSFCEVGPSLTLDRDLSAREIEELFTQHPAINHLECPSGYHLRPGKYIFQNNAEMAAGKVTKA